MYNGQIPSREIQQCRHCYGWGYELGDQRTVSNLQGNKEINEFDELARSLKPHPSKAQILIETIPNYSTFEKALGTLKSLGIKELQHEILRKGDPALILLQFPGKDLGEAILNLIEAGFVKLKGINPATKPNS